MALLNATKKQWSGTLSASYQYVRVEGFTVVHDWWNYALLKRGYTKRLHPVGMLYYGAAKSFGMERALVGGVGVGLNVVRKSPVKFVRINTIVGYLNFNYSINSSVEGAVLNSFLNASWPLGKQAQLNLQTHGYLAPNESDVYGFQNTVQLAFPITRQVSATLSHMLVYSERVDEGKEQLNTTLLAGILLRPAL